MITKEKLTLLNEAQQGFDKTRRLLESLQQRLETLPTVGALDLGKRTRVSGYGSPVTTESLAFDLDPDEQRQVIATLTAILNDRLAFWRQQGEQLGIMVDAE